MRGEFVDINIVVFEFGENRLEFFECLGITDIFVTLCYSEFSTMIPVAGSAYTYSYATMGELFAWVIGWDLVLEYAVGASTVATSWSRYFVSLLKDFGIHFPMEWAAGPFESVQLPDGTMIASGIINLPAIFIVCLVSMLLMRGIQESARVNSGWCASAAG